LAYVDIASQIYCTVCKKKGTLYKYPLDTYYYAIDTNAILVKLYQNLENELYIHKLFELESNIHDETFQNNENDTFVCDCRRVNKINFKNNLIMLQSHKYLTISLLWQEPPKLEDICRVFITVPQYFKNTDLFHVYNTYDVQDYILQGMIVVDSSNNKHVSFFINNVIEETEYDKIEWFCCNENETKTMNSYKEIVEFCLNNSYYPSLLFYMYINEKIKEPKNIELSSEEINNYIHHCALIDRINSVTYTNIKLKKETLHPTLKDAFVTNDTELITKVNEIKYFPGAHVCNGVDSAFVKKDLSVYCFHLRYLSLNYILERKKKYAARMSDENRRHGYAMHHLFDDSVNQTEFNYYWSIKKNWKDIDFIH
jgi:hypothetical protein